MIAIQRVVSRALSVFFEFSPVKFKRWMEFRYWRRIKRQEGQLKHDHYEYFFTEFFGLARKDYTGKRILDIGCGPRGSLEWISADAECVGLDPLVPQYRSLGIDNHRMKYVHARAEEIPFPDDYFDIVTSFNNIDHVDDIKKAVAEIKRVVSPSGMFLLITEVEHEASATEPQTLPADIASWFTPEFDILSQGICAVRDDHRVYQSLRDNKLFKQGEAGIVHAHFVKKSKK